MSDETPRILPEPASGRDPKTAPNSADPTAAPWQRGLIMVIFAVLFNLAQTVLVFCAFAQFLWLLIDTKRNDWIAGFGESLGRWLQEVARFQTGATEERPFPWSRWPS